MLQNDCVSVTATETRDSYFSADVEYNATPQELLDFLLTSYSGSTNQTIENGQLTRPDFTKRGMGAIGLILCAIQTNSEKRDLYPDEFMKCLNWAQQNAIDIRGSNKQPRGLLEPPTSWGKAPLFDENYKLTSEINQNSSFSILHNKPDIMARIINERISPSAKLIIPLGNGGITGGIDTFSNLQNPDDILHNVYFSSHKKDHEGPIVSGHEMAFLTSAAKDRTVVIYDDQVHSGGSMYEAIKYFHCELGTEAVYGVASNHALMEYAPELNQNRNFNPVILRSTDSSSPFLEFIIRSKPNLARFDQFGTIKFNANATDKSQRYSFTIAYPTPTIQKW